MKSKSNLFKGTIQNQKYILFYGRYLKNTQIIEQNG